MRLMMSKSKSVARKIIVPSGQLSAGGHTHGRTSQISSTSSWPTMQRRAPSVEERRVRGSRRLDAGPRPRGSRHERKTGLRSFVVLDCLIGHDRGACGTSTAVP